MKLTSLTIKTLLTAAILSSSLVAKAQSTRRPPPDPPPAKAPSYRVVRDATAPAGWQRYEFGVGPVISALLPAKPEEFLEQKSLGGAKQAVIHMYTSATEGAVYAAYYAEDLPFIAERMPEKFRQSFYEGMLKGFMGGMQQAISESGLLFEVKAGARRQTKFEGLDGVEFDFTFGPMQGLARMAIAGQRSYMAISMWTEDIPRKERELFFSSFRILKR